MSQILNIKFRTNIYSMELEPDFFQPPENEFNGKCGIELEYCIDSHLSRVLYSIY